MNAPSGYLVVRCHPPDGSGRPEKPYQGVGRVPAYPPDDEEEEPMVDDYVFGGLKDDDTNLIPSLDTARELFESLAAIGRHEYEIIYCCHGPELVCAALHNQHVEQLGYDVVSFADYWSIVDDFVPSTWATPFFRSLNEHGLFRKRTDAEAYLRHYRAHGEPDNDAPFEIVHVSRVLPDE
jgi:hypothetical protein